MEDRLVRTRAEDVNAPTPLCASVSILTPSPKRKKTEKVSEYGEIVEHVEEVEDVEPALIASERVPPASTSLRNVRVGESIEAETRISDGPIDAEVINFGDSIEGERKDSDNSIEVERQGSDACLKSEKRSVDVIEMETQTRNLDNSIGAERRRSGQSIVVEERRFNDSIEARKFDDCRNAQIRISIDSIKVERSLDASVEAGKRNLDASVELETRSISLGKVNSDHSPSKKPALTSNGNGIAKKPKKKPVNVWAKSSSRKGGKRSSKTSVKPNSNTKSVSHQNFAKENCVYIIPAKNQDKSEDGPGMSVVLSKFHKSEKIELSEDRLSAGSTKGYRMVRATRGVTDGAWYFEILVERLGKTGHTRLGWSTQKGELQAPVGFDINSYGYRDVDGSKVHMAIREPYGEPYVEGDVIGFYINLPNGEALAPKSASLVSYKGHPYIVDQNEEPPKAVSGSEIAFFRNGVFQGIAFKDIFAGRYFPAASMYTLPNEPNCTVRFNFGPAFRFPPQEIGDGRPIPQALSSAPHCSLDFGSTWMNESKAVNVGQTLEPYKTVETSSLS